MGQYFLSGQCFEDIPLFLLLPGVRSTNGRIVKSSRGILNPGSKASLRRMLSAWTLVQSSVVRQSEQHKDDVKKPQ